MKSSLREAGINIFNEDNIVIQRRGQIKTMRVIVVLASLAGGVPEIWVLNYHPTFAPKLTELEQMTNRLNYRLQIGTEDLREIFAEQMTVSRI